MPRTKAIEEIAGLMKGLRSTRQQSPIFTMVIRDEWLVSFDFAIVIHSVHSMLKNSIHSIQKLMNGPSVTLRGTLFHSETGLGLWLKRKPFRICEPKHGANETGEC